ncbi:hypothetical protein F4780DRAFT_774484 [Xylariomycetidae sp. FL0641]|nr:hypothetical protein F4780DRAFT_774484 [Xylariomycetidae sp. FL0641]
MCSRDLSHPPPGPLKKDLFVNPFADQLTRSLVLRMEFTNAMPVALYNDCIGYGNVQEVSMDYRSYNGHSALYNDCIGYGNIQGVHDNVQSEEIDRFFKFQRSIGACDEQGGAYGYFQIANWEFQSGVTILVTQSGVKVDRIGHTHSLIKHLIALILYKTASSVKVDRIGHTHSHIEHLIALIIYKAAKMDRSRQVPRLDIAEAFKVMTFDDSNRVWSGGGPPSAAFSQEFGDHDPNYRAVISDDEDDQNDQAAPADFDGGVYDFHGPSYHPAQTA